MTQKEYKAPIGADQKWKTTELGKCFLTQESKCIQNGGTYWECVDEAQETCNEQYPDMTGELYLVKYLRRAEWKAFQLDF